MKTITFTSTTGTAKEITILPGTSVEDFLDAENVDANSVDVLYNGASVSADEAEDIILEDGDKLELVAKKVKNG